MAPKAKVIAQKQRRMEMASQNKRVADAQEHTVQIAREINATQKAQGAPPMSYPQVQKLYTQLLNGDEFLQFDVSPGPGQSAPAETLDPADVNQALDAATDNGRGARIVSLSTGSGGFTDDVIQTIARRWSEQGVSRNPQWVEAGHGNGHIDIAMSPSLPSFIAEASGVTGRRIISKSNCE